MTKETADVINARIMCSANGPAMIQLCRKLLDSPKKLAENFKLVSEQPHSCEPGVCPAETCAKISAILEFARLEVRQAFLDSKIEEMIAVVKDSDHKRDNPDNISEMLKSAITKAIQDIIPEGTDATVEVIKVEQPRD